MRKTEIDVQNKSIYSCTNSKCVLYVFVFHVKQYFFLITWFFYRYLTTKSKAKYIAFYIRTIG